MENFTFNSCKKLDTTNFIRVGDLSYFEGPQLSLFEELNNGHLYFFDWVDRDQKANRWMIYRVSSKYILQFLSGKISHLELFENRPDEAIYFMDIDIQNKPFFQYVAFQLDNLPDAYVPNNDNFFEFSDCNAFEKIKSVIIDSLSRQKSENEYSKIYRVRVLKHKEIKSNYFNRINGDFKTIPYSITHSKPFNFQIMGILTSNSFENANIKSYASFKKTEALKRKEYANHYN